MMFLPSISILLLFCSLLILGSNADTPVLVGVTTTAGVLTPEVISISIQLELHSRIILRLSTQDIIRATSPLGAKTTGLAVNLTRNSTKRGWEDALNATERWDLALRHLRRGSFVSSIMELEQIRRRPRACSLLSYGTGRTNLHFWHGGVF